MHSLSEYLTEWIISRGGKGPKRKYVGQFPQKRTDKEGIINWLLQNGFVQINKETSDMLINHWTQTGEKCFYVAPHSSNYITWWIRFFDGQHMFTIRTCPAKYIPSNYNDCSIIRNAKPFSGTSKYISLKEIRKYFDEQ